MAEGEGESGDVMLATAVHQSAAPPIIKREHEQVSNQEKSPSKWTPVFGEGCQVSQDAADLYPEHDSQETVKQVSPAAPYQYPAREEQQSTQLESDEECSSLDSSGEGGGNMGQQEPSRDQPTKQHINNVCSGMMGLGGLQALAALQGAAPLGPATVPPPPPPLLNNQLINTPLNLSINASTGNLNTGNLLPGGLGTQQVLQQAAPQQPAAMPQLILASGQLVQGIQGAQLLIPTSQGIATQTILTIPLNSVANNQMVNMAMSNGQVMTTTLANLAHQYGNQHPSGTSPNQGLGPNIGAPLPHLLTNGHHHHHHQQQQQPQPQQQQPQQPHILSPAYQQPSCQPTHAPQQRSPLGPNHYNSPSQNLPSKSPPANGLSNGAPASSSPSPSSSSPLNTISRLAASNSDLTITTTAPKQPPPPQYHHSPTPLDLMDEPNQPMISESRGNTVDGINLDEIKEFAKAFKLRRLSLGLTQTQVGQALSITEGPAYSQSAICSALATQMYCAAQLASQQQSMFEKLDITPKSAQKIKPVLEQWMKEAEERYKSGQNHLTEFIGVEPSKKRKRRTSFTPQALELLNAHFERNTHPSGTEITTLAHQLGYEREVIRIWFCNKRQALKNTVRMMSKSCT